MWKSRIAIPESARRGEIVEIRTLIAHPMETGYRRDFSGRAVPRDIIGRFTCSFEGEVVFEAELAPGIAANPYLAFTIRAQRSGTLTFLWEDEQGRQAQDTRPLRVED